MMYQIHLCIQAGIYSFLINGNCTLGRLKVSVLIYRNINLNLKWIENILSQNKSMSQYQMDSYYDSYYDEIEKMFIMSSNITNVS